MGLMGALLVSILVLGCMAHAITYPATPILHELMIQLFKQVIKLKKLQKSVDGIKWTSVLTGTINLVKVVPIDCTMCWRVLRNGL